AVTGSGAPPQLKNTIVASSDPVNCVAAVVSLGHNLDSGNTCGFTQPGDVVNKDPLLASWADTGGFTKTMRPAGGSPVIDGGDNSGCPATDQRVVTRPQDGDANGVSVCDIGAYELSQYTRNSDIQAIETASPPSLAAPGSNVTYTTVLTNTGGDPFDAVNTTLTDDLPSTLSIVSCWS